MRKVRSLKINSVINLIKTILGIIFPMITFPYASRVLGVENIGKVNYANSVVNYFVLIAGLGIATYATREGAKVRDDQEKVNQLCSEVFIINMISTIAAYAGLVVLMFIPMFHGYRTLILIYGATLVFNLVGISWLFNIFEDFLYITVRTVIFQVISLIMLFCFVRTEEDYLVYAGLIVLSSVGANIFNLFYGRRYIRLFHRSSYNLLKHIKPIFIIFGMSVASTIYLNMDTTMLGVMKGDHDVGLYTAAIKINRIVCSLITSVCTVFIPRLSYYVEKKMKKEFDTLIYQALNYIMCLTIPAAAGLSILSEEIILLFSGMKFIEAVPIMRVICINIVFSVVNGFLTYQIFMPLSKEKETLYATIGGAVVNVILNYFLIKEIGPAGAAMASVIAEMSVFLICRWYMRKFYDSYKLFAELWKYLAATVIMAVVGVWINIRISSVVLSVVFVFVICVAAYVSILVLLKSQLVWGFIGKLCKELKKE